MTLQAESISAGYGRETVLGASGGVSLSLNQGELVAIIGPNGCGKSTLSRVLSGLLRRRSGQVLLADQPIDTIKPGERAKRIAFMPQEPVTPPGLSVRELVCLGRHPHRSGLVGRWTEADTKAVDRAIERCGVTHLANRDALDLSGGERQRAWLAATIAREPSVLILDEPTSSLDPSHQLRVMGLAERLARDEDLAVAIVVHDLDLAAAFATRIIAMHEGHKIADGEPETVLRDARVAEAFGLELAVEHDQMTGRLGCRKRLPAQTLSG